MLLTTTFTGTVSVWSVCLADELQRQQRTAAACPDDAQAWAGDILLIPAAILLCPALTPVLTYLLAWCSDLKGALGAPAYNAKR